MKKDEIEKAKKEYLKSMVGDFEDEMETSIDINHQSDIQTYVHEHVGCELTTYKQQEKWYLIAYHSRTNFDFNVEECKTIEDVTFNVAHDYLYYITIQKLNSSYNLNI